MKFMEENMKGRNIRLPERIHYYILHLFLHLMQTLERKSNNYKSYVGTIIYSNYNFSICKSMVIRSYNWVLYRQ